MSGDGGRAAAGARRKSMRTAGTREQGEEKNLNKRGPELRRRKKNKQTKKLNMKKGREPITFP